MFFDPMYIVLVMLPGLAISGIASLMVKSAFNRYSKVRSIRGMTALRPRKYCSIKPAFMTCGLSRRTGS